MATSEAVSMRRPRVASYLLSYLLDRAVDGLFYVALAWLAAKSSGPVGAAAIIASGSIPRVVMLIPGGAVADRYGLAATSRVTLALRVVLLCVFALSAMSSTPSAVMLALVAAMFGAIDALHMPAIDGLSGLLVEGGDQVRLQGAMTSIGNVMEIVAAPSAALLLAWSAPSVGWLGAVLLAVAAVAVPRADRKPEYMPVVKERLGLALRGVLGYVRHAPELRAMFFVFAVANVAATPAIILGVPLLVTEREGGEATYGALVTAFALGSVAGGLALARWGARLHYPSRWSLLLMLPGGFALGVLARIPGNVVAMATLAVAGLCFAGGAGLLRGRIKVATPPEMMGRMMSLVQASVYSLIPAGMLLFGWISSYWSASVAMLVMGGLMVASAVGALCIGPLRSYVGSESLNVSPQNL